MCFTFVLIFFSRGCLEGAASVDATCRVLSVEVVSAGVCACDKLLTMVASTKRNDILRCELIGYFALLQFSKYAVDHPVDRSSADAVTSADGSVLQVLYDELDEW